MSISSRIRVAGLARNGLRCSHAKRCLATTTPRQREADQPEHEHQQVDVDQLLAQPTWSVSTLLESETSQEKEPRVSSTQLCHLLRLSALPPPSSSAEEAEMVSTLSSQLHFVREIQKVDTAGVQPLQSLRDETVAGDGEAEIGMANSEVQAALSQEEVRGKFHRRIRRRKSESPANGSEQGDEVSWDALATASRTTGRYFVVDGGKEG